MAAYPQNASIAADQVRDIDAAMLFCRSNPISRVEGVWQFADKLTSVLIARDPFATSRFILRIIDADDARVLPGDTIGFLDITPEPDKFRLRLRTGADFKKHAIDCAATLSKDNNGLTIRRPKVKIEPSPTMLLSRFWRIVKVRFADPAAELPQGLIRIYPNKAADPYAIIYL